MFRKYMAFVLVLALIMAVGLSAMALDLGAGMYWEGEDLELMTRLDSKYFSLEAPLGTDLGILKPGVKFGLGFLDSEESELSAISDAYFTSKIKTVFYDNQQQANIYFDTYQVGIGMPSIRFKNFRIRGEFMIEDPLDNEERKFIPEMVFSYVF